MAETVVTCLETSQAMQHYDEDPHLLRPNGVTPPNLLESIELGNEDTVQTDEQTMKEYMEAEHSLVNWEEISRSFCPLGITMINRKPYIY